MNPTLNRPMQKMALIEGSLCPRLLNQAIFCIRKTNSL